MVGRLQASGVRRVPTTWLREIGEGTATLYDLHSLDEHTEAGDGVVLATGRVPQDGLARALDGEVAQLFAIGDALAARMLAARMLAAATYEGQKFARAIGKPGAPAPVAEPWFRPDPPEFAFAPADISRPAHFDK